MVFITIYLFLFIYQINIFSHLVQAESIVLDISNPITYEGFFKDVNVVGHVEITSYIPSVNNNVVGLNDGDEVIWSSSSNDEHVYIVRLYRKYGHTWLAYLYTINLVGRRSRYYVKKQNKWEEVNLIDYEYYMKILEKERILDLKSNVGDGTCFIDDHNLGGIGAKVLIPYPKYQLISVMDGPIPVWLRNNAFDCCTSLVVHGTLESPKLINLNLKISGQFEQRYYRFHENSWKEITKHYFYEILEDLDRKEIEKGEEQTQ